MSIVKNTPRLIFEKTPPFFFYSFLIPSDSRKPHTHTHTLHYPQRTRASIRGVHRKYTSNRRVTIRNGLLPLHPRRGPSPPFAPRRQRHHPRLRRLSALILALPNAQHKAHAALIAHDPTPRQPRPTPRSLQPYPFLSSSPKTRPETAQDKIPAPNGEPAHRGPGAYVTEPGRVSEHGVYSWVDAEEAGGGEGEGGENGGRGEKCPGRGG